MRFGKTLRNSVYERWRDNYIDYMKLKSLLREDEAPDSKSEGWTDDDEGRFVEELVNVQLEKVNAFQLKTYNELRERIEKCESRLEEVVVPKLTNRDRDGDPEDSKEGKKSTLQEVERELNSISSEINELEKYSRVNYTGFLKAAKKHDRRRGSKYRVRPLLQVRLAALPFNSEDYSPLLYRSVSFVKADESSSQEYRLSAMYSYVRQDLNGGTERSQSVSKLKDSGDRYTAYKCINRDTLG